MNPVQPPAWAVRLLRWFCRPEISDEIEGDLHEEFLKRAKARGLFVARVRFFLSVLSFIRPFAIKRNVPSLPGTAIFGSYVQIAWRGMIRHKMFTAINILGLSLSLSVGLVLVALISDIMKFDHFHTNKDRIRRITSTVYDPSRGVDERATAPLPLAEKLQDVAGIKSVTRINRALLDETVINGNEIPVEGYFTDPEFFDIFSFPFVKGDPKQALRNQHSLVLTRATATKLFKSIDVVGRTITMKSLGEFIVTGVVEDIPKQSHLQFDVLSSFNTALVLERDGKLRRTSEAWDVSYRTYVYFTLQPGYNDDEVQQILNTVSKEVYADPAKYRATFQIQSLLSILPGKELSMQIGPKMLNWPLMILSTLAIVIILSACFNYTNLSIARSLRRTKEVALRKINGARRNEVITQFLIESVFLSLLALIAGIWLFTVIRPHFLENSPVMNKLADMNLSIALAGRFVVLAIVVGIIAGLLPAVLISRLKVLDALKQIKTVRLVGSLGVRNGLVVFQLFLSVFLISGVGIIYRQSDFAINRDLGFDKDNIVVVQLNGMSSHSLSGPMEQLPDVVKVSYASVVPGTASTQPALVIINDGFDSLYVNTMSADRSYVKEFGLHFLAGTNFPDTLAGEREMFAIINRQFLSILKLTNPFDALGKTIRRDSMDLQIIGVVEDFPYTDIEDPIGPFLIRNSPKDFQVAFVRIHARDVVSAKLHIESAWKAVAGDKLFVARFYEEEIEDTYMFYTRLMRIFGYVGSLAFVIAVLGLLGMTTYAVETRKKEIGIRKVLGARERQVVYLISKGFITLLIVATALALPSVYLLFERVIFTWDAYHISLGPGEMSVAPLILLLIGGGTVAIQTWRAARTNPADTLRAE